MFLILALLLSLSAPLLLLPIEKLLPYPYFIEESVKLIIVVMILRAVKTPQLKNAWLWVFLAGFLFAVSESILYLTNIFSIGNLMLFPKRLLLTGILHTSTVVLMYFLGRKSYPGLVVGFVGAILVHYLFNLWVVSL